MHQFPGTIPALDADQPLYFSLSLLPKCTISGADDRICNGRNAQKNTPTDFLSTVCGILFGGNYPVCDVLSGYYGNSRKRRLCEYLFEVDGQLGADYKKLKNEAKNSALSADVQLHSSLLSTSCASLRSI